MMKKKIVTVSKSKPAKKYLAVGILIIFLPLLGLLVKSFPYFIKTKIIKSELTIGTIWKIEASQKLADYIEENSVPANYLDYFKGEKIKVRINGDVTLSYDEAENRIVNKQWDIAFTTSPILSIFAKEQGYSYIAGMFPSSSNYQAGLFVRQDSPIQSINDINAKTKVALGAFTSASSFYMPIYDLYGRVITANIGNRGGAIIDLVKNGKADIGSAAIGDSVRKNDPDLRIIQVSRDIPGAGVYSSPNLSESDRDSIKKLMLNAPESIQKESNYGDKLEADYTDFKNIVKRVEEILICTDFSKNPVILACDNNFQTLQGKVSSVAIEGNSYLLKLSTSSQIYNIYVATNIIQKTFGSNNLTDIQGKFVAIKTEQIGKNNKIIINQSKQLKILKTQ